MARGTSDVTPDASMRQCIIARETVSTRALEALAFEIAPSTKTASAGSEAVQLSTSPACVWPLAHAILFGILLIERLAPWRVEIDRAAVRRGERVRRGALVYHIAADWIAREIRGVITPDACVGIERILDFLIEFVAVRVHAVSFLVCGAQPLGARCNLSIFHFSQQTRAPVA